MCSQYLFRKMENLLKSEAKHNTKCGIFVSAVKISVRDNRITFHLENSIFCHEIKYETFCQLCYSDEIDFHFSESFLKRRQKSFFGILLDCK